MPLLRPSVRVPLVLSLALVAGALPAGAQGPQGAQGAKGAKGARVERGWPLDAGGMVRVHNYWGSTRVIGWERDSVSVTGTLAAGDRFHGGGARTGVKMFVEAQEEGSTAGSAIVVRVPAGARVWVKSAGATVEVSGVSGGVEVNTVGGDVRVTGRPRELTAEAMQGAVELDVTSPWVRARTATGAITVRGAIEDLGVVTVGGRVVTEAAGLRRARVESVSGNVRFAGAVDRDGALTVETHNGAVDLALPPGVAADFALQTIAAPIENALTDRRAVPSRQRGGQELHFTAGGGGAQVTVRSFKGRVRLLRR